MEVQPVRVTLKLDRVDVSVKNNLYAPEVTSLSDLSHAPPVLRKWMGLTWWPYPKEPQLKSDRWQFIAKGRAPQVASPLFSLLTCRVVARTNKPFFAN